MAGRREGDSFEDYPINRGEQSGLLNIGGLAANHPNMSGQPKYARPNEQRSVNKDVSYEEPRHGCLEMIHLILTTVLWLIGVAVIVIGAVLLTNIRDKGMKNLQPFGPLQNSSILVIVIGSVILVIGVFGCLSVRLRKRLMLYTFAAILSCLIILEITTCSLVWYHKKGQTLENVLSNVIERVIHQYGGGRAVYEGYSNYDSRIIDYYFNRNALSTIEFHFRCCGANGFNDYKRVGTEVPPSCYNQDYYNSVGFNQSGCVEALQDFLFKYGLAIGLLCILALLIQIVLIVSSCILAGRAKSDDRVAQRYQTPDKREPVHTPTATHHAAASTQPLHEDV